MQDMTRGVLLGAAAGAAGTTALNIVTYLDMAVRGRPVSSTPEDTVEALSGLVHVPVPGAAQARSNRLQGLGAPTAATVGALLGTNGPMTLLGVTDPRTWPVSSWVADIVPHLAYGAVTVAVLDRLDLA